MTASYFLVIGTIVSKSIDSGLIDHFLVNEAIINLCTVGGVNHIYSDGIYSDGIFHSPAFVHLDISSMPVYIQDRNNFIPKVAWYKTSQCDIDTYKYNLQHELENLTVPACINKCTDSCCESFSHKEDINKYYDTLLNVLISAGEHLPKTCKPDDSTCVPGWTNHVKPFKDESIFWKRLYDQQKPNASGFVTHMMRSSRNAYHYPVRRVKTNRKLLRKCNF